MRASSASSTATGYSRLRRGRISEVGRAYLVTTVTLHRKAIFRDWVPASAVAAAIQSCSGRSRFLCWVLMPDHLHVLIQLGEEPLGHCTRRLKSVTALQANRACQRRGSVWQAGFHDRALRFESEVLPTARYIIANPLRAGLAREIGDYPFWNAEWLDGDVVL